MTKFVYAFKEGNKEMKSLLGGKGANLAEMTNIGLNVPPGFTITTEACNAYYDKGEQLWPELLEEVASHMAAVEQAMGKSFGAGEHPLLFSVRSGAVFSMPGMMDTILNLGLNDEAVEAVARATGNPRFAYDSYRRFIQMFSDVAMDIPKVRFESLLEKMKAERGVQLDTDLTAADLRELVQLYKGVYSEEKGEPFPQDPQQQLRASIEAVFRSWNNPRANVYRRLHDISHTLGTAVNIQAMVFGNMGETSGTGVAFTRNPATGERALFGEYLLNAQGEDVVAGIRTPEPITRLQEMMPAIYDEFTRAADLLEAHYKDMQDLEFTIEDGKLYLLQARNGKRTAKAAVSIAVDLVDEGVISKEDAILRIDPNQLNQLLHPNFDEKALAGAARLAKGLPASPGAASGRIYFHAADVVEAKKRGECAILVRQETSPEDIEGMVSAEGILTSRGGMTSHAAVVARGMGKCCVAGCSDVKVDEQSKVLRAAGRELREGDFLSLDGSTGLVYEGEIAKLETSMIPSFETLMSWVDEHRKLQVRANADNPKDARAAFGFGAEGIGLTRTEHMFFEEGRISAVRSMIMSRTQEERVGYLNRLLDVQRDDFIGIYKEAQGRPVTVRLLDPPLHEFVPTAPKDIEALAKAMGIEADDLRRRIDDLEEVNPMLGHRGCRLAVTYPEIYSMQARAITEAAIEVGGVTPEIMIPLIGDPDELKNVKRTIVDTVEMVIKETGQSIPYLVGTMIEVPRAALLADEIAEDAEFFSFGTNDLTQMTYGFSRDDAGSFIEDYCEKGVFAKSPFEVLDQRGVGKLMKMAVELGRKTRPDIKLGICGEHGGEPSSVAFCHHLGLDYVSCSPFRVPIARLALAQTAIRETRGQN